MEHSIKLLEAALESARERAKAARATAASLRQSYWHQKGSKPGDARHRLTAAMDAQAAAAEAEAADYRSTLLLVLGECIRTMSADARAMLRGKARYLEETSTSKSGHEERMEQARALRQKASDMQLQVEAYRDLRNRLLADRPTPTTPTTEGDQP